MTDESGCRVCRRRVFRQIREFQCCGVACVTSFFHLTPPITAPSRGFRLDLRLWPPATIILPTAIKRMWDIFRMIRLNSPYPLPPPPQKRPSLETFRLEAWWTTISRIHRSPHKRKSVNSTYRAPPTYLPTHHVVRIHLREYWHTYAHAHRRWQTNTYTIVSWSVVPAAVCLALLMHYPLPRGGWDGYRCGRVEYREGGRDRKDERKVRGKAIQMGNTGVCVWGPIVARVLINNELLDAVRRFAGWTVCERAFRSRVIERRRVVTPSEGALVKTERTARAGNFAVLFAICENCPGPICMCVGVRVRVWRSERKWRIYQTWMDSILTNGFFHFLPLVFLTDLLK